jgi:A/G-specific adenine glycosylase
MDRGALLDWSRPGTGREMPWRAAAGVRPDPYHVWLSEIMLQQTTVTGRPYSANSVARFPAVQDAGGGG